MTADELRAALQREPTIGERISVAVSLASYQAWHAGVTWGAEHGAGEWDDASTAWADWLERQPR